VAGTNFTRVEPALERVLRRAARGHEARPARRYVRGPVPAARVDEVVPAPNPSSSAGDGGSPTLAWAGFGALALLAVGGVGLRRR
jgi:hypothetical protein